MAAGVSLFGVDNELGMSGALLLVCALATGQGGLRSSPVQSNSVSAGSP